MCNYVPHIYTALIVRMWVCVYMWVLIILVIVSIYMKPVPTQSHTHVHLMRTAVTCVIWCYRINRRWLWLPHFVVSCFVYVVFNWSHRNHWYNHWLLMFDKGLLKCLKIRYNKGCFKTSSIYVWREHRKFVIGFIVSDFMLLLTYQLVTS